MKARADTEAKHYPLVTFAVFAYRQERFIAEAIEGALAQDYLRLQIILSDDCSPDGTFEIIKQRVSSYSGPHEVIINRNEQNLGLAEHINRVVDLADGDWIVMAAGDDVSVPNRTRNLVEFAQGTASTLKLVCSTNRFIGEEGNEIAGRSGLDRPYIAHPGKWAAAFGPIHRGATHMVHKSIFTLFRNFRPDLVNEDMVNTYRAMLLGGWSLLDVPLVSYRVRDGSLSGRVGDFVTCESFLLNRSQWAGRMAVVARQMLVDTRSALEHGLIDVQLAHELRTTLRARVLAHAADKLFYQQLLTGSCSRIRRPVRALIRVQRLTKIERGGVRAVLMLLRALVPLQYKRIICRKIGARRTAY